MSVVFRIAIPVLIAAVAIVACEMQPKAPTESAYSPARMTMMEAARDEQNRRAAAGLLGGGLVPASCDNAGPWWQVAPKASAQTN